jgi:hypothetical protein
MRSKWQLRSSSEESCWREQWRSRNKKADEPQGASNLHIKLSDKSLWSISDINLAKSYDRWRGRLIWTDNRWRHKDSKRQKLAALDDLVITMWLQFASPLCLIIIGSHAWTQINGLVSSKATSWLEDNAWILRDPTDSWRSKKKKVLTNICCMYARKLIAHPCMPWNHAKVWIGKLFHVAKKKVHGTPVYLWMEW